MPGALPQFLMAWLKRPTNHPDVIQERGIAAAAALATATASPPPYHGTPSTRSSSPLRVRPSASASLPPIRYISRTPPCRENTTPVWPVQLNDCASHSALFTAPRLVDIEALEASDDETSTAAAPSFEFDESRALNIYRVATQRERRRSNPPRRRPTQYLCRPCSRTFTSYRQRIVHEAGLPHQRVIAAASYPREKLHCKVCVKRFDNANDAEQHYRDTIHHRALRKQRTIRK